jgi:hypothetical protein
LIDLTPEKNRHLLAGLAAAKANANNVPILTAERFEHRLRYGRAKEARAISQIGLQQLMDLGFVIGREQIGVDPHGLLVAAARRRKRNKRKRSYEERAPVNLTEPHFRPF